MSIDNILIPGGILTAWQGPQAPEEKNHTVRNEQFDVTQVARRRARTLSFRRDNRFDHGRPALGPRGSGARLNSGLHSAAQPIPRGQRQRQPPPSAQLPRRSNTVHIYGLGRIRYSDPGTFAGSKSGSQRGFSNSISDRKNSLRQQLQTTNVEDLDNSYIFQSLEKYQLGKLHNGQQDINPPVFLTRSSSVHRNKSGRDSFRGPRERSQSTTSHFAAIDVVRRASVVVESAVDKAKDTVAHALRRSSLQEVYEKAKIRQVQMTRSTLVQNTFEYSFYALMLATVYFVFVGVPLWDGLVLTIYYLFDMKLVVPAGTAIFLGIGFLYAYLPLLIMFEEEPPLKPPPDSSSQAESGNVNDTALLIPCYKSEKLIAATLEAALKVFPAQNIFVIANGNSPTPLDKTASVCEQYGVSHTWSPIGSKIVAQFVGCYVSKRFPYVLLIDDDCLLPPNFPIVTDRIKGKVLCIGYTIKSVGPDSSKGTLCQQAQDVEYKISGIQRAFAGKIGSATFPHGAISIWDRQLLIKTFQNHPGFSVSEDWFFGHVARQLGCRIQMCTAVFVETETPSAIFFSSGGARGGFGEMTIWKQRFFRWNYFFVSGLFWDMSYIIKNWRLGWWEMGAKLFVFQEVYETLLYLLAPFVLPISFYVRPSFSGYLYAATLALYQINVMIFNYVHLRSRNQTVSFLCLTYYLWYKIVLTFVNIASCYYSIYKYAKYFAKRHPKVIEDSKAVAVVLRLEEESYEPTEKAAIIAGPSTVEKESQLARRFTVTAVGTNLTSVAQESQADLEATEVDVVDFAAQLTSVPENGTPGTELDRVTNKPLRMPPPIPPPCSHRFSWQRTTSGNSSGSNVSPLDERKRSQFPLPSPDPPMQRPRKESIIPFPILEDTTPTNDGRPNAQSSLPSSETLPSTFASKADPAPIEELPPRRPSPSLFRRSIPTVFLRRSPSDRTPQVRQPLGAPQPQPQYPTRTLTQPPHALPQSQPQPPPRTLTDRILRRPSSNQISPSPSPNPEHGFVVVSSAQRISGGGWPLPTNQADASRYIFALADTGNEYTYPRDGRSRERLFISEEDEEDERGGEDKEGDEDTGKGLDDGVGEDERDRDEDEEEEYMVRTSTGTKRSSGGLSRLIISAEDDWRAQNQS